MNLADLMRQGSLRALATATPATFATHSPESGRAVATVAKVAVAEARDRKAANDPEPDPDRWCWPHSSAMNTGEIDTFLQRAALFAQRGLSADDAETLADMLVKRDRQDDPRRTCTECVHLASAASWQCDNPERAWREIRHFTTPNAAERATGLHMCGGFRSNTPAG